MKKIVAGILILIFIFALTTGCSSKKNTKKIDETSQAKNLISKAKTNTKKTDSLEKEIDKKEASADKLSDNAQDDKQNYEINLEVDKNIKNQKKFTEKSLASLKEASKLKIAKSLKRYVDLELKAQETRLESIRMAIKAQSGFVKMAKKVVETGELTEEDMDNYINNEAISKGRFLNRTYKKQKEKAEMYYDALNKVKN